MVSGASWIRRGSYSKRMRCFSKYLTNITSNDERKVKRLPFTLTRQSYLRFPMAFRIPTWEPVRLDVSLTRHPQDNVLPCTNCEDTTDAVLPQSHLHNQCTRFICGLFSRFSISRATSLPNRLPVKSIRLSAAAHILHLSANSPCNLVVSRENSRPQSHRQNHERIFLRPIMVSEPNRLPVKSVSPNNAIRLLNALAQPHEVVSPLFRLVVNTVDSLPHSHTQRQHVCLPFLPAYSSAVSLPNTMPVKSLSCPPRFRFSIVPSNNNAPHACPVKLPRRHIKHERRSYQYSTRACRLGNCHFTMKGAI